MVRIYNVIMIVLVDNKVSLISNTCSGHNLLENFLPSYLLFMVIYCYEDMLNTSVIWYQVGYRNGFHIEKKTNKPLRILTFNFLLIFIDLLRLDLYIVEFIFQNCTILCIPYCIGEYKLVPTCLSVVKNSLISEQTD